MKAITLHSTERPNLEFLFIILLVKAVYQIFFLKQVLGQYIENLMAASNVFQATGDTKGRKGYSQILFLV